MEFRRVLCRSILAETPVGGTPLVLCAKVIEAKTRLLISEVVREVAPAAPIAVISGPTFAHEVAAGLPAAVTLACEDESLRARLAERLAGPAFRPYEIGRASGTERVCQSV